ncbi:dodecin family protein [Alkalibacter mobilis]|uniref:dodecin family protein n=1 Tax=Alkalibacter mobilis TaxID=2787712 RepID=UPI00189DF799|nr:dodecin family protein [Alkalibacter mobilis]MBF7096271.1 dodecin domain-containing protein [Alkalibacter mobilis]
MSVVKVIELLAESNVSWEAAAKDAVKEAAKTVKNIKSIYVSGLQGVVEGDEIVKYRADVKVSFVVKE